MESYHTDLLCCETMILNSTIYLCQHRLFSFESLQCGWADSFWVNVTDRFCIFKWNNPQRKSLIHRYFNKGTHWIGCLQPIKERIMLITEPNQHKSAKTASRSLRSKKMREQFRNRLQIMHPKSQKNEFTLFESVLVKSMRSIGNFPIVPWIKTNRSSKTIIN